jgi:hypothetical protein
MPIARQISEGTMPFIPDECGLLLQELIPQCWSKEPKDRPTFDMIFSKFELAVFAVPPEADSPSGSC